MLYAQLVNTSAGYGNNKELAQLVLNEFYPVAAVSMGQSSTSITLQGKSGVFNSVNLEFYKKVNDEYVVHNIYKDPEYNPYIRGLRYYLN